MPFTQLSQNFTLKCVFTPQVVHPGEQGRARQGGQLPAYGGDSHPAGSQRDSPLLHQLKVHPGAYIVRYTSAFIALWERYIT